MDIYTDQGLSQSQVPPRGKKEATRARIVERAMPLFSESGYDKITMDTIAKAAGISRANVYLHFKTKSEIVAAMLELLSPEVVEMYRQLDQIDVGDRAGLRLWVTTAAQLWIDRKRQLETLEHAIAIEPVVTGRWYQTLGEAAEAMTAYLGGFPEGRERDRARMAAIAMMLGFERTLFFVVVRGQPADFNDVLDVLTAQWQTLLAGNSTPSTPPITQSGADGQ